MDNDAQGNGSPIPNRPGLDTQTIIDILREHAEEYSTNGMVTYSSLSNAVGKTIDGTSGHLTTARRNLLKHHNQLWICIPAIGVKLATSSEAVEHAMGMQKSSGRKVKKSTKSLGTVKVGELNVTEKVQYDTAGSLAFFLLQVHRRKVRDAITQRVVDSGNRIEADGIIKLLEKKGET
jgi:hypothetical protein